MAKWFETSTWRNLIDMHIPDWNENFLSKFDPKEYVDALADAGVDNAILYTGNCLGMCFWPTKAGHMHKGLKGRNINIETFKLAREKGMKVVMYYNIWNRWAYDVHPDWRMVTMDGLTTTENKDHVRVSRFGQVCINNQEYRDFVKAQITDIAQSFDADGLWIDMIGYFGTVCCCPACRKRYLQDTGREIPTTINWNDPEWVRFVRKREDWFTDVTNMIRETALTVNSKLSLTFQGGSILSGWGGGVNMGFIEANDYLAGDFYGPPMQYSVTCKYFNNITNIRPMEFMTSRCENLSDHTSTKSIDELRNSAMGAFMNNAAFVFIDAIDPMGTINRDFYRMMGELHESVRPFEEAVSPNAKLLSDVAIYSNLRSVYEPKDNGYRLDQVPSRVPRIKGLTEIGRTMVTGRVMFDIISERQLNDLSRYPSILLPSEYVLDDNEIKAFEKYVNDGGILIMTGETGMNDGAGSRRADFALNGLFGVHYEGETFENAGYMAPTEIGQVCFSGNTKTYPLAIHSEMTKVKADADVDVLATITLPYSRVDEVYHFGSAISNPPGVETDYPALTLRRVGKGKAVYIAAPLEKETYSHQRCLVTDLVKYLLDKRTVSYEVPEWLEVMAWRDEKNSCYQLNMLNSIYEVSNLIARDLKFKLEIPEKIKQVREVGTGRTLDFEYVDGALLLKVDEICDFSMLRLDY